MNDIAIVGGGMAGASLAAALSGAATVLILEAESQAGYHSTGRSAAFWSESYGGPLIQPLTSLSGPLLADGGFLRPRGAIHIAEAGERHRLATMQSSFPDVLLQPLERAALEAAIPGLRPAWIDGLAEPSCADIDVAGLHAFYLRQARANGAVLMPDARLRRAARENGKWRIETDAGTFESDILVDAAGAWADDVANRCGERALAIKPYRRTIAQLRVDPAAPPDLPLIVDASERFYFKPEAGGRLWLSPHDETPSEPCDCAPEEIDVALAIDRLERVVDWRIEAVERKWAGLRTFAPDRALKLGFDPGEPRFFWCAGQGGMGIQTAPAASLLCATLIRGEPLPAELAGIDPADFQPR